MEVRAHAKVNLSLRVLRRRDDGFHEIETLMAPITLSDTLEIFATDRFVFRCSDPSLSTGEDNLVVRAARLFFAETKLPPCVALTLEKRIPHGAGLGGGSSDAAATLRGLDQFFSAKLAPERLREMAAQLGSDVPFFLGEGAAVCRGRGEIIEPTRFPGPFRLLLLKPRFAISTPWAYSRWAEAKKIPGAFYEGQEFRGQTFVNDLERPVFEKFPFLAQLKDWLRTQPEIALALMAGSGSSLFGLLHDEARGEPLLERARAEVDPDLFGLLVETV